MVLYSLIFTLLDIILLLKALVDAHILMLDATLRFHVFLNLAVF